MTENGRDVVMLLATVLLAVVGWFAKTSFDDFKATMKAVAGDVAKATTKLELHDARIVQLERELTHQRIVLDDLRGFLARRGFQERAVNRSSEEA